MKLEENEVGGGRNGNKKWEDKRTYTRKRLTRYNFANGRKRVQRQLHPQMQMGQVWPLRKFTTSAK